jgi:hypothetical protein
LWQRATTPATASAPGTPHNPTLHGQTAGSASGVAALRHAEPVAMTAPLDNSLAAQHDTQAEAEAPDEEQRRTMSGKLLTSSAPDAVTETLPKLPTALLVELAPGMLEIVEIRQATHGDEEGEWVLLRNTQLAPVQLLGCRLSDEGDKHQYHFPECVLAPAAELRVRMWSGVDTPTDLYVGRKLPWWNNTGDTAYLSDANGALLATFRYDALPADA